MFRGSYHGKRGFMDLRAEVSTQVAASILPAWSARLERVPDEATVHAADFGSYTQEERRCRFKDERQWKHPLPLSTGRMPGTWRFLKGRFVAG